MTDPIADMLTRIRNAVTARHARVEMPASKLKAEIARILQDEGYIAGFKMVETPAERAGQGRAPADADVPEVRPRRREGDLRASSASAVRAAASTRTATKCRRCSAGSASCILTTSRGVMTGRAAQQAGVGGEILCNVW